MLTPLRILSWLWQRSARRIVQNTRELHAAGKMDFKEADA
jgi:hypothetical protein